MYWTENFLCATKKNFCVKLFWYMPFKILFRILISNIFIANQFAQVFFRRIQYWIQMLETSVSFIEAFNEKNLYKLCVWNPWKIASGRKFGLYAKIDSHTNAFYTENFPNWRSLGPNLMFTKLHNFENGNFCKSC